jgi:hypothetical protein
MPIDGRFRQLIQGSQIAIDSDLLMICRPFCTTTPIALNYIIHHDYFHSVIEGRTALAVLKSAFHIESLLAVQHLIASDVQQQNVTWCTL